MSSVQSIAIEYRNTDIKVKRQSDNVCLDTQFMDAVERTPFGRRLFESREAAKLTQDQAAKAVGMKSQGTLAEAETGGKRSGFTPQLAALYGVDPIWLATGKPVTRATPTSTREPEIKRKFVQQLCDIAETINDIGLNKLLPIVKDYAAMHPIKTTRQKRAKAA